MSHFLLSCLTILTISLACNHPTPASARPLNPAAAAPTPTKDLKLTALAVIGEAKGKILSTRAFIKEKIKTEKEEDVLGQLKDCLQAFKLVKPDMLFKSAMLDTPDGRSDVLDILSETDDEVTYDCGWQFLTHNPPVVKELHDRVMDFSNTLGRAIAVVQKMG